MKDGRKAVFDSSFASVARAFVGDLFALARPRLAGTASLILLGAMLEGLGLLLLVPLLTIVTDAGPRAIGRRVNDVFAAIGVTDPVARLSLLLLMFAVLIVVRAVVIAKRDLRLAEWQLDFVEQLRLRIVEALASVSWERISRLRHARVTHLMSGEIGRIGAAGQVVLRMIVSVVTLLAQAVLAFLLAPAFALAAGAVLLLSVVLFAPMIRQAHRVATITTGTNLSLFDMTGQFLGGLKLAISQNLQGAFLGEFRTSLADLRGRQIGFRRRQLKAQLTFSIVSALGGALIVLVGYGVFHLSAATLITLIIVIARMSGPAVQVQQGLQQLAQVLPAYKPLKELQHELESGPVSVALAGQPLAEGPVVFANVAFQHADNTGAAGVRELNVTIAPGEFVGVTGPWPAIVLIAHRAESLALCDRVLRFEDGRCL